MRTTWQWRGREHEAHGGFAPLVWIFLLLMFVVLTVIFAAMVLLTPVHLIIRLVFHRRGWFFTKDNGQTWCATIDRGVFDRWPPAP
jgi:hypothetical protein